MALHGIVEDVACHIPHICKKYFMFEKTLCFNFIINFVIIDQVGSRIIVFNLLNILLINK